VDVPRKRPRSRRSLWIAGASAAAIAAAAGLARAGRAAPVVERATIRIDEVRRGPMLRQVRAPGSLVPVEVRLITADSAGRVERLLVRRGASVAADTALLELSNPDVNLQSLEAERQLAAAEAQLVELRNTLEGQRLQQVALLASLRAERAEAERRAGADAQLAGKGFASEAEAARSAERRAELDERLGVEERRLTLLGEGLAERSAAWRAQIAKLRDVAAFRRRQLEGLRVRAGAEGVVHELPLELGQWVTPGQLLARLAVGAGLRADLRVPEAQAKDVAVGQPVDVDTRNGIAPGRVARIAPSAHDGSVTVEVDLPGGPPPGARADLSVDGEILVERLADVLYLGRPVGAVPGGRMALYRLSADGSAAERVTVRLGRASATTIELADGLAAGDRVVLSDMAGANGAESVRLR
jgi:multidrug efflux pump subunit AcrA (membrane-fusion protein)